MARVSLYNHTKTKAGKRPTIPDVLLRKLISSAARWIGCNPSGVPVIVRWALHMKGHAQPGSHVNHGYLLGKRNWSDGDYQYLPCKGGWIEVAISHDRFERQSMWSDRGLGLAQDLWETLVHEFGHILDFQERTFRQWKPGQPHHKRPCEQSVYNRITDKGAQHGRHSFSGQVRLPKHVYEAILNLAIWFEENQPGG